MIFLIDVVTDDVTGPGIGAVVGGVAMALYNSKKVKKGARIIISSIPVIKNLLSTDTKKEDLSQEEELSLLIRLLNQNDRIIQQQEEIISIIKHK